MEYDQSLQFQGQKYHFKTWYEQFANKYEELAEKDGVLKAFSSLSQMRIEIDNKLDSLKDELELFSQMISDILQPDFEIDSKTNIDALYSEISIASKLTFSKYTIGDFNIGAMDRERLQEKLKEYLKVTDQKSNKGLLYQVPLAYKKRYIADKLYHQMKAINYLIEKLISEDYPKSVPKLEINKGELEAFLLDKKETRGTNTPEEFFRDIYTILLEINRKDKKDSELFRKDGSLIIKRATEYALEQEDYFEKWGKDEENEDKGFVFEWHEKKFKEIYEALFKN
ncbi:hypothetical protein LQ318_11335 [Aliifodinibius salicampi]|uniref:Uncharacterized protein n=1 Tax=Fodinibius salicampi TaxID=1920655 RepID=A0ABT3Q082_9BACT|nr:hypothetical protein [Fodinibius salicampi]MCW9713496.1 hypothetical protein [Fodinibius salicampi]